MDGVNPKPRNPFHGPSAPACTPYSAHGQPQHAAVHPTCGEKGTTWKGCTYSVRVISGGARVGTSVAAPFGHSCCAACDRRTLSRHRFTAPRLQLVPVTAHSRLWRTVYAYVEATGPTAVHAERRGEREVAECLQDVSIAGPSASAITVCGRIDLGQCGKT